MHPDEHSLALQWDAPANIDNFDIEYYTIQVLSSVESDGKEYELNVTGSELEYPFGVIMNSNTSSAQYESSNYNLTVSAVSKCSQQGPEASAAATITLPMYTPKVNTNSSIAADCISDSSSAITFNSNCDALYVIALSIATLMIII